MSGRESSEVRPRRPSWVSVAAAASVGLVVLIAIALGGDGVTESAQTITGTPTSTTSGQGDDPSDSVVSVPTSDGAVEGVSADDLVSIRTPRPGKYVYEVVEFVDGERRERTDTRVIERLTVTEGDERFRITTARDTSEQVEEVSTSPAGRFVVNTTLNSPFGQTRCAWTPSWPLHGPLEEDGQWTYESSCTGSIGEASTELTIVGGGTIRSPALLEVTGEQTGVWLVESTQTADVLIVAGPERIEQRVVEDRTDWIDPLRGIVVRSDTTSQLSGTSNGTITRTEIFIQYESFG